MADKKAASHEKNAIKSMRFECGLLEPDGVKISTNRKTRISSKIKP
jgi:hypothetical protein